MEVRVCINSKKYFEIDLMNQNIGKDDDLKHFKLFVKQFQI